MQKAIDQLVAQGALTKGTSTKDVKISDPQKMKDNMPMAIVAGLNPGLKVESGSNPEQQIQAKTKTSRRTTMLTGPQGLKDTDLKLKRKRLLGTET